MSECWHNGKPKRRYRTRADAKNAIRSHTANGLDMTGMQPYRCSRCGWFHLGHYPTSETVRRVKRAAHRGGDALTRAVDRILFGPPAQPAQPVTRQRWDRLVAAGAVVEHEDDRPA